jgi:hypothetical protein
MPREEDATEEQVANYERVLPPLAKQKPVTDEEARVLASLFPPEGTLFGVAWELLHLIETAPHWPLADVLDTNPETEWIARLRKRVENTIEHEREGRDR